jgi:flagella basal body P-ring formation protein FlgA
MTRIFLLLAVLTAADLAMAGALVPLRPIRALTPLQPGDFALSEADVPGALSDPAAVAGQEAVLALYPGRAVMPGDIAPLARVEKNQVVRLIFTRSTLTITAEGRALDRGRTGDVIRVLNLSSKKTIFGKVLADGSVEAGA